MRGIDVSRERGFSDYAKNGRTESDAMRSRAEIAAGVIGMLALTGVLKYAVPTSIEAGFALETCVIGWFCLQPA